MKKINLLTLFFVSKVVCLFVGIAHVQAATDVDGTGFGQESHVTGTTVGQLYQAPGTDQAEKGKNLTLNTDVPRIVQDEASSHKVIEINVLHVFYISANSDFVKFTLPTGKFRRFEIHRGFAKDPEVTKQNPTEDAGQKHFRNKKRKRDKSNA